MTTPIHLRETLRLTEGSILPQSREIELTVIKAGFGNKAGNRYYSADLLAKSAKMFEGAKMYVDHLTPAQEKALGGMPRSVRDLVATLKETWYDPASQSVKGRARVTRDWFMELVMNDPSAVEVSIDAIGAARNGMAEGRKARVVEAFHRVRSVDFVSIAGAGGSIDAILEAQQEADQMALETIDIAALKQHRPDLIEEIVKEAAAANDGNQSSDDDNIKEGDAPKAPAISAEQIKESISEAIAEAKKEIEAKADERVALVENRSIVRQMIEAASLPEASAADIYSRFHDHCIMEADGEKDAVSVLREKVQEAIKDKKDEIRQWMPKGGITGMGPSASLLAQEGEGEGAAAPSMPMHDQLVSSLGLADDKTGEEQA